MDKKRLTWRRLLARVLCGVTASLLLPLGAGAAGEEAPVLGAQRAPQVASAQLPTRTETTPVQARILPLVECVHIALEKQPALAAHRASVASAEAQAQALENLRLAAALSPQVPIRRKQAAHGVLIASAGVKQAEWETIYDVTRNYLSAVYARAQQKVAKRLISRLQGLSLGIKTALAAGARGVTANDRDQVAIYLLLAEARQVEADQGVERALAALREAMGVGCDFCFLVASDRLPATTFALCRGELVHLALERRGEVAQAVNAAAMAALEVDAQGASRALKVPTFGSAADIHARPIPQEFHDNTIYRPGAVGLEMPPVLVGKRPDRVARAHALSERAEAVVGKTKSLVTLEVEGAFLKWQEATQKLLKFNSAATKSDRFVRNAEKDLSVTSDPNKEKASVRYFLDAYVLDAQIRAKVNEYLYQQLLGLAELQRVTAGGFCLGLDGQQPRATQREASDNTGTPQVNPAPE